MASSASDAGDKDRDIREQLVKTGHVDVMLAIGNKFFYTRSLPCTLWFFDKGKPDALKDKVLIDQCSYRNVGSIDYGDKTVYPADWESPFERGLFLPPAPVP